MMRIGWWLLVVSCVTEDFDGDGFIEPEDCNDNNATAFPGAEEVPYDFVDQDCDGFDLTDVDGDGFDSDVVGGSDCNDLRRRVNPLAEEIPYDGIDQNCDGWSDFDFDLDGFEAQGFGGDDCDDTSASVVPLDFDGDGYTPCTGDCDDNDPLRSPGVEPVCGNGVEDDCDGVSDCAPIGRDDIAEAPIRIEGGPSLFEFGAGMALPGDITGDGVPDLVATAERPDGRGMLFVFDGPLGTTTTAEARTVVRIPGGEPRVVDIGDLDGDGLGEVVVTFAADPIAWAAVVPGGLEPGVVELRDVATLELQTLAADRLDANVSVLGGDTLVLGAARADERSGRVYLVPADPSPFPLTLGDVGAVIEGRNAEGIGYFVQVLDVDLDGQQDLVIGGMPDSFDRNTLYIVEGPPTTGRHVVGDLASARVDVPNPWRLVANATQADLDVDGRADLVLGVPAYERRTGAVVAFTSPPSGDVSIEDATIRIVGLGDQSLGESLVAGDHDGDGLPDLLIGAPSTFNEGGDGSSPGSVHIFYGPFERDDLVSLSDDWRLLSAPVKDLRIRTGAQVGLGRLDDDAQLDLAFSVPRLEGGLIVIYPGGASALNGI